ncbi:MAG: AI-2E family transporter [Deltaproteobacteria bacterium]|jgi:predicted PurR-regulated permease PerM|nr:AI-2E family transporter [Deltaproteobacteria bacterium]
MAKKYGFGSAARTHLYIQIAFIGIFIYLLFSFLSFFLPLLIPLIISFALAFFCNPLVSYLEKKKIPRTIGILFILLLAIALFTVFIIFVVPLLAKELKVFIGKIPEYSEQIKNWAVPWIENTFKT